jgi:hypothetical protein
MCEERGEMREFEEAREHMDEMREREGMMKRAELHIRRRLPHVALVKRLSYHSSNDGALKILYETAFEVDLDDKTTPLLELAGDLVNTLSGKEVLDAIRLMGETAPSLPEPYRTRLLELRYGIMAHALNGW